MNKTHILIAATLVLINFSVSKAISPPSTIPKSADISINRMLLENSESVEKILGNKIELIEPQNDFPHINLLNSNKTQLLTLIFHPGNIRNNFSEFRIKYIGKHTNKSALHLKQVQQFTSGKLVTLGINKDKLISTLGNNYQETEGNGAITLKYNLADFDTSSFLKHYNLPIYYGTYIFQNNKLTEFSFGFEYP